ncbi:RNA demethylase ALKBH9B [Lycium ferocissimum]|uniref:RNA demethylase ALKBH9B n=1 Tax=Lycium ferocissimum TaxID=112874 RepID=UPI00281551D8|nr:RNA demethylase ALKBH9B [Lycium ferocissimum]
MSDNQRTHKKDDPFLLNYDVDELRIASEFLSNWLPFLSRDLCHHCTHTLSDRIRSLSFKVGGNAECLKEPKNMSVSTPERCDSDGCNGNQENCDNNSLGGWNDCGDLNDNADTNSLGSWKDGAGGEPFEELSVDRHSSDSCIEGADSLSQPVGEVSTSEALPVTTPKVKMSWADMAQEDELQAEEVSESTALSSQVNGMSEEEITTPESKQKTELSREQREYIRFCNVKRKKDFICLERVNGKIFNILGGLELHKGVFSAVEQTRIVNYVEKLDQMGKNGELKGRTYTAPAKWMRGKGRVTIQFGCCYNYALDKSGNSPGILKSATVDPLPDLMKVMIRRLVRWHVMPPTCVPDSCIINIYEEGDCIPPHIDNHDFVRPFCTVSFLSECNIVFGSNLKIVGPGEFAGAIAIPLPVGSVLVLNGNGADVAKHCVPAVPAKRISITFRRMDEAKRPTEYVSEHDLEGLQPVSYEADTQKKSSSSRPRFSARKQSVGQEESMERVKMPMRRHSEPRYTGRYRRGPPNRQWVGANTEN